MYGTLISSVTVGAGGASSIDFTSIPQTYTDLVLVLSARVTSTGGGEWVFLKFNNDSGSNYSFRNLRGTGTAVNSNTQTSGTSINWIGAVDDAYTVNTFASTTIFIPNYAGSTIKTTSLDKVTENNAALAYQKILAGLWNNTAAINRITLSTSSPTVFMQYTTAYLYGLTKGSGGATVS